MEKWIVRIKDASGACVSYEVIEPVYMYIRQLEMYIQHPSVSKLKEVYKDRFGE